MRKSLTFKITVPLLAVMISVMVVFLLVNINIVHNMLKREIQSHLKDVGDNAVAMVNMNLQMLEKFENSLLETHKRKIKAIVESARAIVEHYYDLFKKGELSEEEAKEKAKEAVDALRYDGGNGYVFITDYSGVMLVHIKRDLIGKNLIDLKDPNGVYLIRDLIKAAKAGGGYVEYMWPKPGDEKLYPKLSYALGFEPWKWMIGTDVYIDDITKGIASLEEEFLNSFRSNLMKIKFGESSYPTVLSEDGTVILHIEEELEGKKASFKDAKTGEDLLELFKANKNGFVEYYYTKPGEKGVYKKLAYVGYVPQKKWLVLMTVYEDEVFSEINRLTVVFSSLLIGGAVVFVFIVWLVMRNLLTKWMKKTDEFASKIGDGDLTADIEIKTEDEIGRLANTIRSMRDSIKDIVARIKEVATRVGERSEDVTNVAEEISSSVDEIASSLDKVVDKANNVAAAVEETTSGVEEVASSAQMVSKTAEELSVQSSSLREAVENGEKALSEIINRIDKVARESHMAVEKVRSLSDSTQNIEAIVETINSIAEQTNLLALNAAIEAARAGEAGKGFAVVADEIRKLAEESRKSTEQIAGILSTIREEAFQVTDITNRLVEMIGDISRESDNISSAFGTIRDQTTALDSMTSNLAASAQEQSAAAQEMSAAMDNATRSINEVVEEMEKVKGQMNELVNYKNKLAETAESLSSVVESVEETLARFRT